jgi:uncharacterized protein YegP (UPF0339 family)
LIAQREVVRVEQAEWWAEFKIFEDRDGSYYWLLQAASGRIIARSGHAYESKYWCVQDVNWLRANADQIMVYDYVRVAPASGSRSPRSSAHPRAGIAAAS